MEALKLNEAEGLFPKLPAQAGPGPPSPSSGLADRCGFMFLGIFISLPGLGSDLWKPLQLQRGRAGPL